MLHNFFNSTSGHFNGIKYHEEPASRGKEIQGGHYVVGKRQDDRHISNTKLTTKKDSADEKGCLDAQDRPFKAIDRLMLPSAFLNKVPRLDGLYVFACVNSLCCPVTSVVNVDDQDSQPEAPFGIKVLVWKCCALVVGILTWVDGFVVVKGAYIMITFSFWAVAFSVLNLCLSCFHSLRQTYYSAEMESIEREVGNEHKNDDCSWIGQTSNCPPLQRLLRCSRRLSSSLATHSGMASSLMYWPYGLANTEKYSAFNLVRAIPAHGGLLLVVLVDAFAVNQIDVSWIQWFLIIFPFDFLYIAWTVIHARAELGNPDYSDNDPLTNDDAIYPGIIEWSMAEWEQSVLFSCIALFVLSPSVFLILKQTSFYLSKFGRLDCRNGCSMLPLIARQQTRDSGSNENIQTETTTIAPGCQQRKSTDSKVCA